MKIKVHSYTMLLCGLALIGTGIYFLWSYMERQKLIEKYGVDSLHEDRITSLGRGGMIEAFLRYTWWTPLGFIIFGGIVVYGAFTEDKKP